MVSTRSLIHWRAASSILALSTRDDGCVAEKTVVGWCSIGLRVTGAAHRAALGICRLQTHHACEHEALYFVRAFADFIDLLIAVHARDRILVHEAVTAMDLHRLVHHAA